MPGRVQVRATAGIRRYANAAPKPFVAGADADLSVHNRWKGHVVRLSPKLRICWNLIGCSGAANILQHTFLLSPIQNASEGQSVTFKQTSTFQRSATNIYPSESGFFIHGNVVRASASKQWNGSCKPQKHQKQTHAAPTATKSNRNTNAKTTCKDKLKKHQYKCMWKTNSVRRVPSHTCRSPQPSGTEGGSQPCI